MKESSRQYDDEIELMDLLLVIWKWKYFIIIGTVICALVAGMVSFSIWKQPPQSYLTKMIIAPEVKYLNEDGDEVFASPAGIKALIEEGVCNDELFSCIKNSYGKSLSALPKFELSIPKETAIVRISCKTPHADEGIMILNCLLEALSEYFADEVKILKDEHENTIKLKGSELADLKVEQERAGRKIDDLDKRLVALDSKIKLVNKEVEQLLKQKNGLAKKDNLNSSVSALLYSNMIQQNLALEAVYRQQIHDYLLQKEAANTDLYDLRKRIDKIPKEIESIQKEKKNIRAVTILHPPASSLVFVKNKTKLNIALASVGGLFLMVFSAFFLEYISNYKNRERR